MKRTTRKAGMAVLCIGGVALLVALVFSCGPRPFHEGGHPGWFCGKKHHGGFFGKDPSEQVLKRLDEHVADLHLTEPQKAQYEEIRQKVKSQFAEGRDMRKRFVADIRDEMKKDRPDIQALAALIKGETRKLPDMVGQHVDLFLEFYNILDEGQKAEVANHFKDRFEKSPFHAGG